MRPAASDSANHAMFRQLQAQLRAWTGISLASRDAEPALGVLAELAAARGLSMQDYLDSLDSARHLPERQSLIDRFSIGITWFMRESDGINVLVDTLIRQLGVGSQVRIWSAGCSTGQEPYGLAMALVEAGLKPRILATDINQEALRTAATACYSTRFTAALPVKWRQRYTSAAGPEFSMINNSIRSLVSFAVHNLASGPLPPPDWGAFDAVVCRNVLIYFDRIDATALVRRIARSCRPGGYILLSAAERPLAWMTDSLEEVDRQSGVVLLQVSRERRLGAESPPALDTSKQLPPDAVKALADAMTPPLAPSGPHRSGPALAQATALMKSDALDSALQLLDDLLARDPLLAAAHLIQGLVLKRLGATQQAVAALRCARFLFADKAWLPPYQLALLLEQTKDRDEACEAYRHTLAAITSGAQSGLLDSDGSEEGLVKTVVEACHKRIGVLQTERT